MGSSCPRSFGKASASLGLHVRTGHCSLRANIASEQRTTEAIATAAITTLQRDAIDDYVELVKSSPDLFRPRQLRPLVLHRDEIEEFVAETGETVGVITSNPYFLVVVDLVRKTNDITGPAVYTYVRVVSSEGLRKAPGVVAVPIIAEPRCGRVGDYVLVKQERHATGTVELEFPRGGSLYGEARNDGVLRELREETGLLGSVRGYLGDIYADAGLSDAYCSAYAIDVFAVADRTPDYSEAIVETVYLSRPQLLESIGSGACRDALSIAAFCLLETKSSNV